MGNIKEIKIKNSAYYFFNDMINMKDFDPNLLKIDKKLYKSIDIYFNGYITLKHYDYVKINSVNPLYFIINKVDGYIKTKKQKKLSNLHKERKIIRIISAGYILNKMLTLELWPLKSLICSEDINKLHLKMFYRRNFKRHTV